VNLKISFTNGIIHMPVAESLTVFYDEITAGLIPIRRPVTRKKRRFHRKSSDRVLLKAMRVLGVPNFIP